MEDDGPGVPVDQRARIIRRGERLDAQHPGQGIGLAVVKDILDSYGGELSLGESPLGGAAFQLALLLRVGFVGALQPVSSQRRNRVWLATEVLACLDEFAARAGRRG